MSAADTPAAVTAAVPPAPAAPPARAGVLLLNTGTPAAPTAPAVRRFLRRFLSDPRVIELPRALWLPLLYGLVLPLRSPRSAHKYREIWLPEGSPLQVHMQALRTALQRQLNAPAAVDGTAAIGGTAPAAGASDGVAVEIGLLYSEPTLAAGLAALRATGAEELVILPVFPQASGTTNGVVHDQLARVLRGWRAYPQLRVLSGYHDEPAYIDALAAQLQAHWHEHGRGGHLLLSFHGIPTACVDRGDRYAAQCHRTAALLAAAAGLADGDWTLSFQSRFGANRWLGPATVQCLAQLPRHRQRSLDVMCPGFAVDCLETLEEIAITGRDVFMAAGGQQFRYIPALNASAAHAAALAQILHRSGHVRPPA